MNGDLFNDTEAGEFSTIKLAEQAVILPGYVREQTEEIKRTIDTIVSQSPLRQMKTPGGRIMSLKMTSCGDYGWISDRRGYRYEHIDPVTKTPWPTMPTFFQEIANTAASEAGFKDYRPDSCLINCYEPGARLSLHQDKNELDFSQPIVSVSLGLPMMFLFGGQERSDKVLKHCLRHSDVVVWGGASRLFYHGTLPLVEGQHAIFKNNRFNLTFRRAK